jgi:hypothetical protein
MSQYFGKVFRPITLIIVLLMMGTTSYAQYKKPKKGRSSITNSKFKVHKNLKKRKRKNYINAIHIGGGFGTSTYYGDLCDGSECFIFRPTAVITGSYRINESMLLRSEVSWVRLWGDDALGQYDYRNLSFRADNIEWNATVVYDIFEYNKMYARRHLFSPYIFLGFGLTTVNPRAELDGKWYGLRKYQTENINYSGVAFVIPYGGGVRMKINPWLDVSAELGYRWAFTDYLDDVSTIYPDQNPDNPGFDWDIISGVQLSKEEAAIREALSDRREEANLANIHQYKNPQRGNPELNDGYFLIQIKAAYTLKVTKQHYNINSNVSRFRIIKSIKRK